MEIARRTVGVLVPQPRVALDEPGVHPRAGRAEGRKHPRACGAVLVALAVQHIRSDEPGQVAVRLIGTKLRRGRDHGHDVGPPQDEQRVKLRTERDRSGLAQPPHQRVRVGL
jgi:hypothetical protein